MFSIKIALEDMIFGVEELQANIRKHVVCGPTQDHIQTICLDLHVKVLEPGHDIRIFLKHKSLAIAHQAREEGIAWNPSRFPQNSRTSCPQKKVVRKRKSKGEKFSSCPSHSATCNKKKTIRMPVLA
jgi:hypothetical protein